MIIFTLGFAVGLGLAPDGRVPLWIAGLAVLLCLLALLWAGSNHEEDEE